MLIQRRLLVFHNLTLRKVIQNNYTIRLQEMQRGNHFSNQKLAEIKSADKFAKQQDFIGAYVLKKSDWEYSGSIPQSAF